MAHIEKRQQARRDGTVSPVVYRVRYNDPSGRERSKTFKRRVDAQRFKTSTEHSVLGGTYIDPGAGRMTFKEYGEQWRANQRHHREGTAKSVEQHLRLHVYPVIGDRAVSSVLRSDIQSLVNGMKNQRTGDPLGGDTVTVIYGRVVAIFHSAVKDRLLVSTPCIDINLPASKPSAVELILDTNQMLAVIEAICPIYRTLVVLGAGTGLRTGELFGLTVDRVDWLRKTLRVDRQLLGVEEAQPKFGPPKTNTSYRTIPLPDVVIETLAAHLRANPTGQDGLVFTNTEGRPILGHTFADAWERACKKAGVPDWAVPKQMRHYYASLLIRAGRSVKVVQARLGHKSATTTLDKYGHLWHDDDDRTRAAVQDEFGSLTAYKRPDSPGRLLGAIAIPGQAANRAQMS